MSDLRRSWQRAWRGLGAGDDGPAVFDALVAAWSEPQRAYHTLQHLEECLAHFGAAITLAAHPTEVEAALWFHDAVYDPRRADNEARSADWAERAARDSGIGADSAQRLHALVMATQHHAAPHDDSDARLLLDIDLAILGAGAARFAQYEAQIRVEYAFVPADLFTAKRGEILRSFLARPRLYATPHFHGLLEARARANLAEALRG